MSDQLPAAPGFNAPLTTPAPASIFQTWIDAVSKPSEQTYARIASLPNAGTGTAFLWVFLGSLVEFAVVLLMSSSGEAQLLRDFGAGQQAPAAADISSRLLGTLCGAPALAMVAVLSFALGVGLMHLIAQAFGGHSTFGQLAFTIAAITVPVQLVGAVLALLSAIPYIGLCFSALTLLLSLYAIVLEVIAVKGVYGIGWGGAVASALLVPVLLFVCAACAVLGSLMALGPVIGNTFSSINSSLQSVP